jgi:RNA polymerase sigma factor (sigma-70 family)
VTVEISFEDFYVQAKHRCLRAVAAHTGNVSAAEELVAEAFTRALRNWDRVCLHASPSAWVVTTALNLQRDRWRRALIAKRFIDSQFNGSSTTPENHGDATNIEPRILRAIAALPNRQRSVLIYRIILDLSTATTADLLKIDPGTVTTHLRRSLSALRNELPAEVLKGTPL